VISRLRGTPAGRTQDGLVLDVGGVGYLVAATTSALGRADGAREVTIETYLHVREDALQLYGFADAAERERLWLGRKKAFGAMGRLSRDLVVQDAVVPRSSLPDVLENIAAIAARYDLRVSNVFHAGDGNLHPNISFDATVPGLRDRVEAASAEIMRACVAAGGTITGEHGIGVDKLRYMPWIFDGDALAAMRAVRRVFDPAERVNPGKVVPVHACREWAGVRGVTAA